MIAAQCLAPLPFRQADGKPPGGVQNRERAEDDKEDSFVHVRITSSSGPPSANAIKRRGGLICVMSTGRSRDPTSTLGCSRIRVRGDPAQRFAPTPMHAGLGAVSVFSRTCGWLVFGRRRRDGDTLSRQLSTSRETARISCSQRVNGLIRLGGRWIAAGSMADGGGRVRGELDLIAGWERLRG